MEEMREVERGKLERGEGRGRWSGGKSFYFW